MMRDGTSGITSGHSCVAKGCNGLAVFGFGTLRGGEPRFACRQHKELLEHGPDRRPPAQEEGRRDRRLGRSSSTNQQGALL